MNLVRVAFNTVDVTELDHYLGIRLFVGCHNPNSNHSQSCEYQTEVFNPRILLNYGQLDSRHNTIDIMLVYCIHVSLVYPTA